VLRVTPTQEEVAAQRAQIEERLAGMTAEQRQQMGNRMEAQLRQLTRGQTIPIYRLMKKTNLPGVLVRSFNEFEARRYIR
jgi:hypothetical protein